MVELLDKVLAAHGGLDTWDRISALTAQLSLGGPFWAARGWPDAAAEQTVFLDTRNERITYQSFPGRGMVSEFRVIRHGCGCPGPFGAVKLAGMQADRP